MELETIIKKDEFKKVIREVVREELDQSYQDMDEIRRSPGGAIIRIEEDIKSMKQRTATIKQNMATKDDLRVIDGKITGPEEKLDERFQGLEGRFQGPEGKIKLTTGLIFVMLTFYSVLIVKVIFFQ